MMRFHRFCCFLFMPLMLLGSRGLRADEEPPSDTEHLETRTAHNSVFVELLGNGLFDSINYERFFGDAGPSARAGIGYFSIGDVRYLSVPLLVNYYVGDGDNMFELGLGAVVVNKSGSNLVLPCEGTAVVPTGLLAYRFVPRDGGFNFGFGATPFWADKLVLWGGISFGAGF